MARARAIKPDFFRNPRVVEASYPARLLFLGLVCLADSAGVAPCHPKRLLMDLFPEQGVKIADIGQWLHELVAVGLVAIYEHEDASFVLVKGFAEHQKDKYPSIRYPSPPKDLVNNQKKQSDLFTSCAGEGSGSIPGALPCHASTLLDSTPVVSDSDSQGKTPSGEKRNGKTKQAARLPDDFEVPLDWLADGKAYVEKHRLRNVEVDLEAERFVNHFLSAPGDKGRKMDWHRTWLNWLLRANEMSRGSRGPNPDLRFDHL